MTVEYRVRLADKDHIVVVSDETEALLAASAAGRASVGVCAGGSIPVEGIPYAVPAFEDASEELARLVLLRHLGLPWIIGETRRLRLRELTAEDALRVPRAECSRQEQLFCEPEQLALYCKRQYGFFEYGTWGVTRKETGELIGLAGVSNPRLPRTLEPLFGREERPWLELGYRIFAPWRRRGYGREAVAAVMDYSREVLETNLCALIGAENEASRRMAEGLGFSLMGSAFTEETDSGSPRELLLYGWCW